MCKYIKCRQIQNSLSRYGEDQRRKHSTRGLDRIYHNEEDSDNRTCQNVCSREFHTISEGIRIIQKCCNKRACKGIIKSVPETLILHGSVDLLVWEVWIKFHEKYQQKYILKNRDKSQDSIRFIARVVLYWKSSVHVECEWLTILFHVISYRHFGRFVFLSSLQGDAEAHSI